MQYATRLKSLPETRPLLALVVLCFLAITVPHDGNAQEVTAELVKVEQREPTRKDRLPGEIVSFQQVNLYARVGGFVEEILVDRGSRVTAGQVLARMTAPELIARRLEVEARIPTAEAQRVDAMARLAAAESTFSRLSEAAKTPGVVAENDVVLAGKSVDSARAQIEAIEKSMEALRASVEAIQALEDFLVVKAPFAGVISERFVHTGALAGPEGAGGSPLFHLRELTRLRLVVAVPESLIQSVRTGAQISFSVASHPGTRFTGTVARPAFAFDTQTRTMPVELDVTNPSGQLSPGMYAEVEWPVRRASASLFVPPSAIKTTTESTFVVRVRDGKAEWVPVKRGIMDGNQVEVLGALNPGDQILLRGSDEVRPGTAVRGR